MKPKAKRDYLLPKGCKDLADVLKPKTKPKPTVRTIALPPTIGRLDVPDRMTVKEVATAVHQPLPRVLAHCRSLFGRSYKASFFVGVAEIMQLAALYGYQANYKPRSE